MKLWQPAFALLGITVLNIAAQAAPIPTLDQIETLACKVSATSENHTSFIPPKVGDSIKIGTWQLDIHELKFDRADHGSGQSYLALLMDLERVDRDGYRNANLRTFVGIRESFAAQTRSEAWLKIEGDGEKITASYSLRQRDLPDGNFAELESLTMDCVPETLWQRIP